jgi:hypothetical protein
MSPLRGSVAWTQTAPAARSPAFHRSAVRSNNTSAQESRSDGSRPALGFNPRSQDATPNQPVAERRPPAEIRHNHNLHSDFLSCRSAASPCVSHHPDDASQGEGLWMAPSNNPGTARSPPHLASRPLQCGCLTYGARWARQIQNPDGAASL